jgi:hypothetical protein
MAEREGFEPPVPVKVRLISSQVHSTGLCHLSAGVRLISSLLVALRPRNRMTSETARCIELMDSVGVEQAESSCPL